jgi:hypothetical protein
MHCAQTYGTVERTAFSRSTWTSPQAVLGGCSVSCLQAVVEYYLILTEQDTVHHRILVQRQENADLSIFKDVKLLTMYGSACQKRH